MSTRAESKSTRLRRVARRLDPEPREFPYYLHTARAEAERAPGWYFIPGGPVEHPVYLGADSVSAEIELMKLGGAVPA